MNLPNELMKIDNHLIHTLKSMLPSYDKGDKRHVARVQNAWIESSYIDEHSGILYIHSIRLHDILRIGRKSDAQYLIEKMPSQSKLYKEDGCYIASCEVMKELDRRMVTSDLKKRGYLTYSEEVFRSIRESPAVVMKQEEIRQNQEQVIKELKKQRIKLLNVKQDELTNKPLKKITAEFSHIRKKALYSYDAVNIYNGLIVNKETHQLITKENLQDEEDLLIFARKMCWNTSWYDEYVQKFT